MESLIEPGMHYDASRDGKVIISSEIQCIHPYRGFLTIFATDITSILCPVEATEESITELQRICWEHQHIYADLRTEFMPASIKVRELPELILYSLGRVGYDELDHDKILSIDMEIVDAIHRNRSQ